MRFFRIKGRRAAALYILCAVVLSGFSGKTQAANAAGDLRLGIAPPALTNGAPFLLTVKTAEKVSRVRGSLLGKPLEFFAGDAAGDLWYALAGVDVEAGPGSYPLEVAAMAAKGRELHATMQVHVGAAKYRTGTLTVAPNFVEPDAETKNEIAAESAIKGKVFAESAAAPEWSGNFAKPVQAAATDSFGTRRTFNGKLASIHKGMDFRAPAGTPVSAANSGTVVLAQKLFYEGNCVIVDHGQGFRTIYMHFSRIDVKAGETVRKGERLGLSGATGRVTGPHLHFAVRWKDAYLDPAGLFGLQLAGKP